MLKLSVGALLATPLVALGEFDCAEAELEVSEGAWSGGMFNYEGHFNTSVNDIASIRTEAGLILTGGIGTGTMEALNVSSSFSTNVIDHFVPQIRNEFSTSFVTGSDSAHGRIYFADNDADMVIFIEELEGGVSGAFGTNFKTGPNIFPASSGSANKIAATRYKGDTYLAVSNDVEGHVAILKDIGETYAAHRMIELPEKAKFGGKTHKPCTTTYLTPPVIDLEFDEHGNLYILQEQVGVYRVPIGNWNKLSLKAPMTTFGTEYTTSCVVSKPVSGNGVIPTDAIGLAILDNSLLFNYAIVGTPDRLVVFAAKDMRPRNVLKHTSVNNLVDVHAHNGKSDDFPNGYVALAKEVENGVFEGVEIGLIDAMDFWRMGKCIDWTYEKQKLWKHSYPQCELKNAQSPLDIKQNDRSVYGYRKDKYFGDLVFDDLTFNPQFTSQTLTVTNTRRMIRITGFQENIMLGGADLVCDYFLEKAELHWGSSEHKLNGRKYDGELHFYFKKDPTFYSTMGTEYAVLAVLLDKGSKDKEFLGDIIDGITQANVARNFQETTVTTQFYWSSALPKDFNEDFYRYFGTSTYPPCEDDITWFIGRYKLDISSGQKNELKKITDYFTGEKLKSTNRKTASHGARTVINSYGKGLVASSNGGGDDNDLLNDLLQQQLQNQDGA